MSMMRTTGLCLLSSDQLRYIQGSILSHQGKPPSGGVQARYIWLATVSVGRRVTSVEKHVPFCEGRETHTLWQVSRTHSNVPQIRLTYTYTRDYKRNQ